VAPGSFRPGISPDVEINSLQGAGVGAEYRNGRLLLPDDRWSVQGKIAAAIRQRLDNSGSSLVITHGALGGRWQSSPLLRAVRPSLSLRADLINRQRSDVQVESFQYATLEGSLDLEVGVGRIWSASIGGGFQRRWLYSVEP